MSDAASSGATRSSIAKSSQEETGKSHRRSRLPDEDGEKRPARRQGALQGPKYTPVSKRGDKPDAIAYLLKHHPEITDAQLGS